VLPPTFVCDSGVLATRLIVACRLGYEPNLTRSKQAPERVKLFDRAPPSQPQDTTQTREKERDKKRKSKSNKDGEEIRVGADILLQRLLGANQRKLLCPSLEMLLRWP
jgi:hypothetical protein